MRIATGGGGSSIAQRLDPAGTFGRQQVSHQRSVINDQRVGIKGGAYLESLGEEIYPRQLRRATWQVSR
ncbi:hypothetical protein [Ferrimicrobium acidiphilum]|uniref:hypothetical protein n=1 Tax=Ferrimicrobium acidiphilum TaxID=121039 RepID=UPI0023F3FE62|nr:hypothetical protein [Ferrimicrobium acidiphilum]